MSSFKDNFGKNEESEALDYDDSAFFFFASAMLIIIIVIYSLYIIRSVVKGKSVIQPGQRVCECDTCQAKLQEKIEKSKTKLNSKKFMIKLVILALLAGALYMCTQRAESVDSMKSFDPFAILDIPSDATEKEIKKAFRKKSLEVHPDKNPDDPLAASKFLQVTRAHNALTDEAARENYKKFGNPDGPGPMKVAIGLPHFLMKKENQIVSLMLSFFFILVVIPIGFFFWYSSSYRYTDKGLRQENERLFAKGLNENLSFADCPKLIAWAADFDEIDIKNKQELEVLSKMNSELCRNKGPSFNNKRGKIVKNSKPHLLLMAYMHRGELSEYYNKLIKYIVVKVPSIIDLWLDISLRFHFAYRSKRAPKNMSFLAMKNIIKFSQYCTQGLWEDHHELMQLPYMTEDRVKSIAKKMKKKSITLKDYLNLSTEARQSHDVLPENELKVAEQCIKNFSQIEVIAEVKTEGLDDIVIMDVVTIVVKLDRTNLEEGQSAGPVCSRTYPELKYEKFYVYLTDKTNTNIFSYVKYDGNEKLQSKEIKFQAPPHMAGDVTLNVHCFSDSYIGLHAESEIKFTIKKEAGESREMYTYHEDDVKREPTLFEMAMQGLKEENSDDEVEEDEDTTQGKSFDSHKKKAKITDSDEEEESD